MMAAKMGHLECVKILAEKEAGIADQAGRTALTIACERHRTEVMEFLVQNVKECDASGFNSFMRQIIKKDLLPLSPHSNHSSSHNDSMTALMLAAIVGDHEMCAQLAK